MSESDTLPFIIAIISILLLGITVFILRFRRIENQHPLDRDIFNFDDYWKKIQYAFWPMFFILVLVFIATIWNDSISTNSKVADTVGIAGLLISIYVALWAYLVECRRRRQEELENIYYKLNLNDLIVSLITNLDFIFRWQTAWELDPIVRAARCTNMINDLTTNRTQIFAICNDLQIINLNPHIPAHIKDQIYLIMIQSRKAISSTPTVPGLPSYYGIVNDVFTRIQKLYEDNYMKDIDRLREEFGNDVVQNMTM